MHSNTRHDSIHLRLAAARRSRPGGLSVCNDAQNTCGLFWYCGDSGFISACNMAPSLVPANSRVELKAMLSTMRPWDNDPNPD
jgi:hypothetical protein